MKLFFSVNSPYARKCRVVAMEKGLQDVEYILVSPMENPPELLAVNPLATVPSLVTDDGFTLCESPVICEYLDSLSTTNSLFPQKGTERFRVLGMAALADGIMDAAVACVLEKRRPEAQRSMEWVIRKESAIRRTIAVLAGQMGTSAPLSIGTINASVALAYVNFRLSHIGWEDDHAQLAAWHKEFSKRPSMQATVPVA